MSLDVIRGPYLADILDQPQALRATFSNLRDQQALEKINQSCNAERFQRVVLTGMGSSFFGLHPLSLELAAHGWTPLMLETSELIHSYPHLLMPSTLVIAVSQSGNSVETVRLMELNARLATVIGVTNWADSTLAQTADFVVLTAAGKEFSVSCKTYVSAQLALHVLGAALCNSDISQRLREMEPVAQIVESYLRDWESHVAEFYDLLHPIRDVFLVGRGTSMAAAGTGALIIKESAHFHAEGMSSAAFRHGPFEMLQAGILVGIFAGDRNTASLNEGLFQDVLRTPARAVMFAANAQSPACRLPDAPEILRPIIEILPVEMMTLALAAHADREAGKFERAAKVTVIE